MRPYPSIQTAVQWLNRICLPALIVIVAGVVWSRFASGPSPLSTPDRMCDYSMNVQMANVICDGRQYPSNFAYPLPGVLLWHAFNSFGFPPGAMAWLLILPASLIGCLVLSERLAAGGEKSLGGITIGIAFAAVNYFAIWDLRATNINSFYLVLILLAAWCWQRDKRVLAGVLLGASVAVKMYSLVFLLYLVFRREWRIALAMLAAILISFVAVPILFFGGHDALRLTVEWLQGIAATSRPGFCLTFPAYKVSLSWTALLLLNPAASGGQLNLLNWSLEAVALAVRAACLVWALLVMGYFASAWRRDAGRHRTPLDFALDISILVLCPLPASSFLQPHHLVVLLVPAVCFVHSMLAQNLPTRLRFVAGLAVGLGFCLTDLGPRYPLRGLGVICTLLVYLVGLWFLRLASPSPHLGVVASKYGTPARLNLGTKP